VPAWKDVCTGTLSEKIAKFADPAKRAALKRRYAEDNGVFSVTGYRLTDIKVGWIPLDVPDGLALQARYEGFTIGEIAEREGKHPIDAFLDVALIGGLKTGFETETMATKPEHMKTIATSPMALPGVSDGGAHTKFITTARFPTELLAYWVREHDIMSLEEAHWRLSAYPAQAAGLKGRGHLAEGMSADIIVYDLNELEFLPQERVWDYPADEWRLIQKAKGYKRIIVNGVTTFIDGHCTGKTPGKLLRHGTA
jgi:N-acyl-D-amino-acid deacylase